MWRRKTTAELADLQRAKVWHNLNPIYALGVGLVTAGGASLFVENPSLSAALVLFVLVSFVGYFIQIFFGRLIVLPIFGTEILVYPENDAAICATCHTFQSPAKQCVRCGGNLEHPEYWKWVPENEMMKNVDTTKVHPV